MIKDSILLKRNMVFVRVSIFSILISIKFDREENTIFSGSGPTSKAGPNAGGSLAVFLACPDRFATGFNQ